MKLSKTVNLKLPQISIVLMLFVSFYSCGTYQSAYNYDDDGIYTANNQKEIVIVENRSNFDQNYFSHQLEELQNLDEEDTFTDIDDYLYYEEDTFENDSISTYNAPWEYTDNVTITIDTGYASSGFYWHNPFFSPYYNNYYPYYYNYYTPWRYYNPYYYSNYYMPWRHYSPYYGSYGNYYSPYNYHTPFYSSYKRYDRSGKRTTYDTTTRRYSQNLSAIKRISRASTTRSNRRTINSTTRSTNKRSINRSDSRVKRQSTTRPKTTSPKNTNTRSSTRTRTTRNPSNNSTRTKSTNRKSNNGNGVLIRSKSSNNRSSSASYRSSSSRSSSSPSRSSNSSSSRSSSGRGSSRN